MLFWNKICCNILIIFFATLSCKAQEADAVINPVAKTYKYGFANSLTFSVLNAKENNSAGQTFSVIPQDYYTQHFGIMCKKELALEKATKIPFRFRLGSLQQCNYLEGKK